MTDPGEKNRWRAIGLGSVDRASVEEAVTRIGWSWQDSLHVSASEVMAKSLRRSGLKALQIVELDDIIRWAGMPTDRRIPVKSYPPFVGPPGGEDREAAEAEFSAKLLEWRRNALQKTNRFAIDMDYEIRRHLRDHAADRDVARILRGMSSELRQAIVFLINAGFRPDDFTGANSSLAVALSAWRSLEDNLPECTNARRDLWENHAAIGDPTDAETRDLRERVESALLHLNGPAGGVEGRIRIVYHGFYFYTPSQWAFFRLLRQLPNVDQLFVVHDDGSGRAFEVWRRYFVQRWNMPRVEHVGSAVPNRRAAALADALEGRRVDDAALSGALRIVKCRNTSEFVREWDEEVNRAPAEGIPAPKLVAAGPNEVKRTLSRMSGDVDTVVNLANLPVGQFLLALHECYDTSTGRVPERVLSPDKLIDIAASGFADSDSDVLRPSRCIPAFKRAMPFFSDLRLLKDWEERAVALERIVKTEVAMLGQRLDGRSDVDRIATAVANELRLIPWCDLTDDEATTIRETIVRIGHLVDEIVAEGMGRPKNYLEWVRRSLERAMVDLTKEERAQLETRLRNAQGVPDYELDFEGIKDVVSMILGRKVDLALDGSPLDDDEGAEAHRVMDIRFADVYGFEPPAGNVHVANLADTVFPTTNKTYMWPFAEEHLRPGGGEPVGVELLRTRNESGSLEALYVFWCLLAGVPDERKLILSWIEESSNSVHNPSVLISMLARVSHKRDGGALEATLGGLQLGRATGASVGAPIHTPIPVGQNSVSDEDVQGAGGRIDRVAASAAILCSRRFAIQWATGRTAAFQSAHTQSILFGNVQGALYHRRRFAGLSDRDRKNRIYALTRDLWRHLTVGQRKSSHVRARVVTEGQPAYWQWTYSLGGKKTGGKPIDIAYQAAFGKVGVPLAALVPAGGLTVLPEPGPDVTKAECNVCPVAPRCSARIFESD